MKILEVRDGFLKFEADKTIALSSFIKIDGLEKSYIAQVIQLKRSGENSIGYAKILFLYNNGLQNYDKTLPPKESEITEFTSEILSDAISAKNPVVAGKTLIEKTPVLIDAAAFDKKMLVSVDDTESNNLLIRNFTKQFNQLSKNVVIIDTLGVIKANKITAGVDFKLPLNTDSLAFMYRDCLNDATGESKAVIVEIFKELAEYSRTVPFVPFEALKTIVDDMVDKAHVFKLLVLKNKLAKFDRLGYFAKNKQEVDSLKHFLNAKCTIIDLSKLDTAFQNRYLEFIYESLKEFSNTQVFLEMSNVVSKKNIKNILSDSNVSTTFVTHSKFKYLNDIKNVFDNFIIVPSFANNSVFNIYSTFISAMKPNSYLIAGEATSYIPLVSALEIIDDVPELKQTEEIQEDSELEAISASENDEESGEIISGEQSEVSDVLETLPGEEPENETVPPSEEEIIANINEKSDDIITQAGENLVVPENMNMFDETEEEGDDVLPAEEYSENNIQEEIPEVIEEIPDNLENNNSETITEEALVSELPPELEENDIVPALEESDLTEEIPLEESFETEVHSAEDEIISDYTAPEVSSDYEELTINEEIEENEPEISLENSELLPDEEENSIELDADIDLDLEEQVEEKPEEEVLPESLDEEADGNIEILPISNDDSGDFDEIVELDPDEADENDIVIDMSEDEVPEEITEEDLDAQIVKDVDKVFTTRKDDDISDSDLDFIDELNNDEEMLLEEVSDDDAVLEEISDNTEDGDGILEAPEEQVELKEENTEPEILETRNSTTPIVPVYDADIPQEDMVMSDPIQQGDTVTHAKYGTGVVEKMIKYGNKTLFSINFDNIGRRLLDPTLTEIKKS